MLEILKKEISFEEKEIYLRIMFVRKIAEILLVSGSLMFV